MLKSVGQISIPVNDASTSIWPGNILTHVGEYAGILGQPSNEYPPPPPPVPSGPFKSILPLNAI